MKTLFALILIGVIQFPAPAYPQPEPTPEPEFVIPMRPVAEPETPSCECVEA